MRKFPDNLFRKALGLQVMLLILGMVFPFSKVASALELNFEGFQVPDTKEARYIGFMTRDNTDRIPGEETLIKLYMYKDGARLNVVSIKGRIWSYYVDRDGAPPFEYIIADQNGDGIFESRFGPGEDIVIPYWSFHNDGVGGEE